VYSEFGTLAFEIEVSKKVNSHLRHPSKETVLGNGYGLGRDRFYRYLWLKSMQMTPPQTPPSREVTDNLHSTYRTLCWEVPRLWKYYDYYIQHMYTKPQEPLDILGGSTIVDKRVILPNGAALDYRQLTPTSNGGWRVGNSNFWGGVFVENHVQALARILMTDAWLASVDQARERDIPLRVVLSSHDEFAVNTPDKHVADVVDIVGGALVVVPDWLEGIPLACEVFTGKCYDKASEPMTFKSKSKRG
jgi:hypothetical protein